MNQLFSQVLNLLNKVEVPHSLLGSGRGGGSSIVDSYFTSPLATGTATFSTFSVAIVGLISLVGGLKIYNRWMQGDDNVRIYIFRWLVAIIAVIMTLSALQYITKNQPQLSEGFNTDGITNTWQP